MNGLVFLGIAYAITWLGITLYLLSIVKRQRELEKRMAELTKRTEE